MAIGVTLLVAATSLTTGVAGTFNNANKINSTIVSYSYWNGPNNKSSTSVIDYGENHKVLPPSRRVNAPSMHEDDFDYQTSHSTDEGNDVPSGAAKLFDRFDLVNQNYQCSLDNVNLYKEKNLNEHKLHPEIDMDYYYFDLSSDSQIHIVVNSKVDNLEFKLLDIDYDWGKYDIDVNLDDPHYNDMTPTGGNVYYQDFYLPYGGYPTPYQNSSLQYDRHRNKLLNSVSGVKKSSCQYSFDGTLKAGTYYLFFEKQNRDSKQYPSSQMADYLLTEYSVSVKVNQLEYEEDKSIDSMRFNYGYGGALWQADFMPTEFRSGYPFSAFQTKNKYDSVSKYVLEEGADDWAINHPSSGNTSDNMGKWVLNENYASPEINSDRYYASDSYYVAVENVNCSLTYETPVERSNPDYIKDFSLDLLMNKGYVYPDTVLYLWDKEMIKNIQPIFQELSSLFSVLLNDNLSKSAELKNELLNILKSKDDLASTSEWISLISDTYSNVTIANDAKSLIEAFNTVLGVASASNPYSALAVAIIVTVLDVGLSVVEKIVDSQIDELTDQEIAVLNSIVEKDEASILFSLVASYFANLSQKMGDMISDNSIGAEVIAIPLSAYKVVKTNDTFKVDYCFAGVSMDTAKIGYDFTYNEDFVSPSETFKKLNNKSYSPRLPGKVYGLTNSKGLGDAFTDNQNYVLRKASSLNNASCSDNPGTILSGDYRWYQFTAPKADVYGFYAEANYQSEYDNQPVIEPFDKIVGGYITEGMKCDEDSLIQKSIGNMRYSFYDIKLEKGQKIYLRLHGTSSTKNYDKLNGAHIEVFSINDSVYETKNYLKNEHVCSYTEKACLSSEMHRLYCWKGQKNCKSKEAYHNLRIKTTIYTATSKRIIEKSCSVCGYYVKISNGKVVSTI